MEWLRHRINEAPRDLTMERGRRLESDADAVQVLTIHSCKGLQFPVTYVPFGWDRFVADPDLLILHDDAGARVLDVGGNTDPAFAGRRRRHDAEDSGEDLRLLYVALTRAQCQLVTWWAPKANTRTSALHRLLLARSAAGTVPPETHPVPDDDTVLARLGELGSPDLAVERVVPAEPARWTPPATPARALAAAQFRRQLDTGWQRTSYSRLTATAHHSPGVGSEPEVNAHDDDANPRIELTHDVVDGPDVPSPMADLPAGAAFGTIVHAVIETTDNPCASIRASSPQRCCRLSRRRSGRWPAGGACATSPRATGSPNWTSSSRSTAATARPPTETSPWPSWDG